MNVPKLLTTISGEEVTGVEIWERFRREEILQLFCDHVYGRRDMERPDDETFLLLKEAQVLLFPLWVRTIPLLKKKAFVSPYSV